MSGSALISFPRAKALAKCAGAALRDEDVFPVGAVEISGMKVAATHTLETVLGTAAALVQEIGGGVARAFTEFARQQYVPVPQAEHPRFFESGGIAGQVGGRDALLGTASFLMRMGVRVTEGVRLQSALFLAVGGAFAGIFSIKYTAQNPVHAAFRTLRSARITPVLAVRDVNITQAAVEGRFDLRAGLTDFPDLAARMRLSEGGFGGEGETLALMSRDGMLPFAETVASARRARRAVRFGQTLGLVALLLGLMIMYFLAYRGEVAAGAPHSVLLYQLLWLVPAGLGSRMTTG
jgi:hypothetical protein